MRSRHLAYLLVSLVLFLGAGLGTIAPGRDADLVAVRGDVRTQIDLLQSVDVVVKNGVRVR